MRILRAHGMATSAIHVIFNAVVIAKLTYAASSWWGFTTADDRQRLEASFVAAFVLDFALLSTCL